MTAYQRAVDRRLQPELTVSRRLQELFNFAPPPYVALMRRSEEFWLFFCHLIRGAGFIECSNSGSRVLTGLTLTEGAWYDSHLYYMPPSGPVRVEIPFTLLQ